MSTHYEVLEITKQATAIEIKKAYFGMVRKYTPERCPEKFMEIRRAYETLSNEEMKVEYDEWISMPTAVQSHLELVKRLFEQGEYPKAIGVLEDLKQSFPQMLMIQNLLGEAYLQNNNPGKAIKVFENLVAADAKNANFIGNLAQAYLMRGWHKRSLDTFKHGISIDEDNYWLWAGLTDAYMARRQVDHAKKCLHKLLTIDQVGESFLVSIYFKLFLIDLSEHNLESMNENLEKLSQIVNIKEEKEGIAWMLFAIANQMIERQGFSLARDLIRKAADMIPDNKEVKHLKEKLEKFCNIEDEFSQLEGDDNYADDFIGFIASLVLPESGIDDDIYICLMEYSFLNNFNTNKRYILLLKKQYPGIYHELQGYFEDVLNQRKRAKRIKEKEKFLNENRKLVEAYMFRHMLDEASEDYDEGNWDGDQYESAWDADEDDYFNPYDIQEPYIRAEAKVGRNDSCPCGSGKKYKKCCGK